MADNQETESASAADTDCFHLACERWMPGRHVLPLAYRPAAERIQNMTVKDSDAWVVTFPKSGTTWMQETVWLLLNNLDFPTALRMKLGDRAPFVEFPLMRTFETLDEECFDANMKKIENLPGRRVIKSHLFWERLPCALRDPETKAKIVYVARHPKDVCISYFYFNRILGSSAHHALSRNLQQYGETFLNDRVVYSPYWAHVMEFWKRRTQPNIFFVWYEEMKENLAGVLKRLADFLEVPQPSEDGMKQLVQHLSFESMKNNPAVNMTEVFNFSASPFNDPENAAFIRKGSVNQWKEKMSPELADKFDAWIKKNTEGTDFKFYK